MLALVTAAACTFPLRSTSAQVKASGNQEPALDQIQADIHAHRWAQAQAELETVSNKLAGQPEYHFLRGAVLFHAGQLMGAAQELGSAIALAPNQGRYYLLRAQVYQKAGDLAAAERDFRKSIELTPENPAAVLLLAELQIQRQRPPDAIPELERALKRTPKDSTLEFELGKVHEILGHQKEAILAYQRAIALDPKLAEAYAGLGRVYRQSPDTLGRSVAPLERAVLLEPQSPTFHYELGLTFLQEQEWQAARRELEQTTKLAPGEARGYSPLAQVYSQLGMTEKAREARERFNQLAQDAEKEKLRLARLESDFKRAQELEFSGRRADAIALYEQILAASPREPQVHLALARLYLNDHQPSEAVQSIQQALALQPDDADYHQVYALALQDLGRLPEAERELRASILLRPSDGASDNLLGNLLLREGRVNEAIAAYQHAIEAVPNEPDYHVNLAGAYTRKGDRVAAEREREAYRKLVGQPQTPPQ